MTQKAFTLSKASEVEASIDVDEAAKKRSWSKRWPDHGDERDVAGVVDDHDHDHGDQTDGVGDDIVGNIGGEDRFATVMKKSKRKQKYFKIHILQPENGGHWMIFKKIVFISKALLSI